MKDWGLISNPRAYILDCRACIANVVLIIYTTRSLRENADLSYNTARQGLSVCAEISFGTIVTCVFTLPKFIDAKGTKLQGVLWSLTRPFTSLRSGGSFGNIMHSKKNSTESQEVTLNRFNMIGESESNLPFNRDQDIERYPSDQGVENPAKFPSVNATDTPHRI